MERKIEFWYFHGKFTSPSVFSEPNQNHSEPRDPRLDPGAAFRPGIAHLQPRRKAGIGDRGPDLGQPDTPPPDEKDRKRMYLTMPRVIKKKC